MNTNVIKSLMLSFRTGCTRVGRQAKMDDNKKNEFFFFKC